MSQHNLYYSHANQPSHNPECSPGKQHFGDQRCKGKSHRTDRPTTFAGLGLSMSMPSGANSYSPHIVAPADRPLEFSFESPHIPHESPIVYTPLTSQSHVHAWSPDGFVRRSSITASTLSLDESCPPSTTSFEESINHLNFTDADFLSSTEPQSIGLGLGISCGPMGNQVPSLPSQKVPTNQLCYDIPGNASANINTDIEFLLKSEPFSENEKSEDWLLDSKNDPFPADFFRVKEEPYEGPSMNEVSLCPVMPVSNSSVTHSGKKSAPTTPRKLRKAKSFNAGGMRYTPSTNFSMDNCLNEFHVQEGKILFRDETARVSKQQSSPSLSKRKSVSKFQNLGQLLKSKTSPHLGMHVSSKTGERRKRGMDAGFGIFQVDLNPDTSSGSSSSLLEHDLGKPDGWSAYTKKLS